jgi:hypothetical protein
MMFSYFFICLLELYHIARHLVNAHLSSAILSFMIVPTSFRAAAAYFHFRTALNWCLRQIRRGRTTRSFCPPNRHHRTFAWKTAIES